MKNQKKVDLDLLESDQLLLNKLSNKYITEISLQESQRLKFFEKCGLEFRELGDNSCRLKYPLDLLDIEFIRSHLSTKVSRSISTIKLSNVIDSTNSYLLDLSEDLQHGNVCIAEYQTSGRGRRGRQWVAPFAAGLCLSTAWTLQKQIDQFQLISFLPAVALLRVLKSLNLKNIAAKWPNDVYCEQQKLAGVLVEVSTSQKDTQCIVIGMGLNVYNRTSLLDNIDQPWTSLDQNLNFVPSRSQLAAMLISEVFLLLQTVEQDGMSSIREEWCQHDLLSGESVNVVFGGNEFCGVARGINEDGSINIEIDEEIKQFSSGEVSLRPG